MSLEYFGSGDPPAWWKRAVSKIAVNPETSCWVWQGAYRTSAEWPYPALRVEGKTAGVHRLMLEIKLGRKLRPGMLACHTCDVTMCANPEHLFEGTNQDNVDDKCHKGRWRGPRGTRVTLQS